MVQSGFVLLKLMMKIMCDMCECEHNEVGGGLHDQLLIDDERLVQWTSQKNRNQINTEKFINSKVNRCSSFLWWVAERRELKQNLKHCLDFFLHKDALSF